MSRSPTESRVNDLDTGLPLSAGNFVCIARNGFGDPGNAYCHGMGWFGDALYIGTTRCTLYGSTPYERGKYLHVWPVKVPDITWDLDWRGQIWRFDPAVGDLRNVYISPMVMGSRGFDIALLSGIRDMVEFKGRSDPCPAIYAVAWGSHMGPGPQILRSVDGFHFECTPLGKHARFASTKGLRPLVVLKDRIFVANVGTVSKSDPDQRGGSVLVSEDPASGDWQPACEVSFGDPQNITIFELREFNGFVYAGTINAHKGFELWKTDAEGSPPFKWTRVLSHGAYRGPLNELVISLWPFKNALYLGTAIYNCGYDRIYNIGPAAPELIRIHPDDSWDLLVGETRDTPDGLKVPTSGMGPGFNNITSGYIWRICDHDGWLYASTAVWTPWMSFAKPRDWGERGRRLFECLSDDKFMQEYGGFDLWRSNDGDHWAPVTRNGLGNRYNVGCRTMVSTPFGLFAGTANQYGPKVARKRVAGWRYEPNDQGGVELYLGTHRPLPAPISVVRIEEAPRWRSTPPEALEVRSMPDELLGEFYGGTGWRRMGFWTARIRSAKEACENLVDELLAFTRPDEALREPSHPTPERLDAWIAKRPPRPWDTCPSVIEPPPARKDVIDVACGLGDSTNYLLKYFDADTVVGVAGTRRDLGICRRRFPHARFARSGLPKLKTGTRRFDIALCVEGLPEHDRATLLGEIHRVLKPGGQLVASDLLGGKGRGGEEHSADHARLLEELGFERVRIIDVTSSCALPFRQQYTSFLATKILEADVDEASVRAAEAALPAGGEEVSTYLLISAHRKAH